MYIVSVPGISIQNMVDILLCKSPYLHVRTCVYVCLYALRTCGHLYIFTHTHVYPYIYIHIHTRFTYLSINRDAYMCLPSSCPSRSASLAFALTIFFLFPNNPLYPFLRNHAQFPRSALQKEKIASFTLHRQASPAPART